MLPDSIDIVCPSGLQGRIRGMKFEEMRLLNRQPQNGQSSADGALLRACWLEATDVGPYECDVSTFSWDNALPGDRLFALLQIRCQTFGADYAFRVTCSNPACRAHIDWLLDLRALPIRYFSERSRDAFAAGNRFSLTLPQSGQRVVYRLLTGVDVQNIARLQRNSHVDTELATLDACVIEIDGVDPLNKRQTLDQLPGRDIDALLSDIDASGCGVETGITIECPRCLDQQEIELPFTKTFWLPSADRRSRASSQP